MHTEVDVVIVGAGPVGLFQVFELGLQGLSCVVVDALPEAGGQCIELYPDKPIYDIPAVPMCTGRELIDLLMKQISPFESPVHLDQTVESLDKNEDGTFSLGTSNGLNFRCKAVVIAAGVGSFSPVKVRVDGLDKFENDQVFYRVKNPEQHAGKHITILGGGDSAIDWAIALVDKAASLTLVNRTERFRAAEGSVNKLMALKDAGKVNVVFGAIKAFTENDGELSSVHCHVRDEQKSEIDIALDHLLVFFGLSPKLGPVEHWGLNLEKNLLTVDCETYATAERGIYAVGDINTYPGKKKLILSGFHETALAASAIKQMIEPDQKQFTQYTTTSTVLQKRLGV